MSKSPILGINEIAPDQSNKHITHNTAIAELEGATQDIYNNTAVGAGPVVLNEDESRLHYVFRFSGSSAPFSVKFPSQINGANAKRNFIVANRDTTNALTVTTPAGTGVSIAVPPLGYALVMQDHDDMAAVAGMTSTSAPYDIGFFVPGLLTANAVVAQIVATRSVILADNFAGSVGAVGANPTATATFTVKKNGTSVGTFVVSTAGVFTFNTTGTTVDLIAGDILTVVAPSSADATLANVSIMLAGTRSA